MHPLWRRLPRFFALPLELPVVARILLLAAGGAALLPLASGGRSLWLLSLVAAPLLFLAGAAYGFVIVDRSARGFLFPSRYPRGAGHGLAVVFQYLALPTILLLLVVAVAVVTGRPALATVAFALLFVGLLPAMTIRLVATGSLGHALAPAEWVEAIASIGRPYIALCAFLAVIELARYYGPLLVLGAAGLSFVAPGDTAPGAGGLVAVAALFGAGVLYWYLTYVAAALLGYAIYRYADRLGVTVVGRGDRMRFAGTLVGRVDMERRTRDALLDRMASAGEVSEAIAMVQDELRLRPNDLALHARLHRLLVKQGDPIHIENHADRLIVLLTRTGSAAEALPIVADLVQRNPAWQPRDPQHVAPLARAALAAGRFELAAHLVRRFDRRFPHHEDLPEIYLIGALVLIQSAGPSPQSTQLLERVACDFPRHRAAKEALRYLQRLPDAAIVRPESLPRG